MIEKQALNYWRTGLSVLPAERARKSPRIPWKTYQERRPTETEVTAWFSSKPDALCIICGRVSGNLEVIDFDNHGELFPKWKESIPAELLAKLVIEETPSGGYHVAYRCAGEICGNIKLAQGVREDKTVTLIETRGEGGLVLCAPTEGYRLSQGDYAALPTLSGEERETLLMEAWRLNENFEAFPPSEAAESGPDSRFLKRPGDDYNERGDVRALLLRHGWKSLGKRPDGNEYWQRPGKDGSGQNSATLKNGVFYVFSSNAAPFQPGTAYAPFSVYALLECDGDYISAADELLQSGYGELADLYPDVNLTELLKNLEKKAREKECGVPGKRIYPLGELIAQFPKLHEPVIDGLLRVGETMNIIAAPKTGKSWLATDLALSVATGRGWFGYSTRQGKVLILDNELHAATSAFRIPKVLSARGIPLNEVEHSVFVENQRGHLGSLTGLASRLDELKAYGFKLVIVDALYRALPEKTDENDNAAMARLYNVIDHYAEYLNAAFVLIHHSSKGNQANKSVTDVGAGAGAQSRATDAHLILRRHDEADCVVMDTATRSFPKPDRLCLRWTFPVWNPDYSMDPDELEGLEEKQKNKKKFEVVDLARLAVDYVDNAHPRGKTEFTELLRSLFGLSKERARQVLEYALQNGMLLEKPMEGGGSKYRALKQIVRKI